MRRPRLPFLPAVVAAAALVAAVACGGAQAPPAPTAPAEPVADVFWTRLSALCGKAFEGLPTEIPAGDTTFAARPLIMHVVDCAPRAIRIAVHVGENRSHTWVVSREGDGLRLKHDRRREDGTPEDVTQYGGDWDPAASTATSIAFPADAHTAALRPAATTNVWTLELDPGSRFVYAMRREGTDRRIRLVFQLVPEVAAPPAAWGAGSGD